MFDNKVSDKKPEQEKIENNNIQYSSMTPKQRREAFIHLRPVGQDYGKLPQYYDEIIKEFEFGNKSGKKIAFIVVAHFLHDLPYFLEAISSMGDIAALISKQSGTVKGVRKAIYEVYDDIIFKHINKDNLKDPEIALSFFLDLFENNKKWKDYQFIILDHGGYFAPCLNDIIEALPEFKEKIIGIVEHTLNGDVKYDKALKGNFPVPVLSIAKSQLKALENNAVTRSINNALSICIGGFGIQQDINTIKCILVIGCGNIGKHIVLNLKQLLGNAKAEEVIYIYDWSKEVVNRTKKIFPENHVTNDKYEFLSEADLIITATSTIALYKEDFKKLKKNVIIACATSGDDQIEQNIFKVYVNDLPKHEDPIIDWKLKQKAIRNQPCVKYHHKEDEQDIFYLVANGNTINFLIGSTANTIIHLVLGLVCVLAYRLLIKSSPLELNKIHQPLIEDERKLKQILEKIYGPIEEETTLLLKKISKDLYLVKHEKLTLICKILSEKINIFIEEAKFNVVSSENLIFSISHLQAIANYMRIEQGNTNDKTPSAINGFIKEIDEIMFRAGQQQKSVEEEKPILKKNLIQTYFNKGQLKKLMEEQELLEENKLFLPLLINAWEKAIIDGHTSKNLLMQLPLNEFTQKLAGHLKTAGIKAEFFDKNHELFSSCSILEIAEIEERHLLVLKNAKVTVRHNLNNYLSILQWLITTAFGVGEKYIKWFENELTKSHFNLFESVPTLPPNLFRRETLLNEIIQKLGEQKLSQRQVVIHGESNTGKTSLALMFCYEQYRKYYNEVIWVEGFQLKKALRNINFEKKTNCLLVINDVCFYEEIADQIPTANIDILVITYNDKQSGLHYIQVNDLSIEESRNFIVQQLGKRSIDKFEYYDSLIKYTGLNVFQLANTVNFIKQNRISIPRFLSLHNVENMSTEKFKLEIDSASALNTVKENDPKSTLDFENNRFIIFQPEQRLRPWHLPTQNPNFTGRRELLQDLYDKLKIEPLTQYNPITLTACEGLGGIGKTQIAIEYAHCHIKYYRLICWIPAQDKHSIDNAYLELIDYLKISINRQDAIEKKIEAVKNYFQKNQGNLLIFDDAKDYETIKPYIPKLGSAVLVTSRYKDVNWQHTLEIKEFTLKEAMKYVKKILQIKDNNQDRIIEELCETMGRLPLALAQATAYVWEQKITVTEYLEIYHNNKLILSNTAMPVVGKHEPVYVTYRMAIEAIKKQSSYAAELINYCAFLDNNNIPGFFLELIKHEDEEQKKTVHKPNKNIFIMGLNGYDNRNSFEESLGLLQRYSLVTINENNYQFSLHQLLYVIVKQQVLPQSNIKKESMRALFLAFISHVLSTKKETVLNFTRLMSRRILMPHLLIFLQYDLKHEVPECNEKVIEAFLFSIAETYACIGNVEMAKLILKKLKSHITTFDIDDSYEFLGELDMMILSDENDPNNSINKMEQILKKRINKYGIKSEQVADALGGLGTAYIQLDPKKALNYLLLSEEILLEIGFKSVGNPRILNLIKEIARAYGELGYIDKKYNLLKAALNFYNLVFGEKHPNTAVILLNLGQTCFLLFKSQEGIGYLEKALRWAENFFTEKDNQSLAADIYIALGNAYLQLNQADMSLSILMKALKIGKSYCDEMDPKMAFILSSLGNAYGVLNNYKKKCELMHEALKIYEKHYPPNYPQISIINSELANAYGELGNHQEKCCLLEKALPILKSHYGLNHPQVAYAAGNLGQSYKELNQFDKALPYLQQAYMIFYEKAGSEHQNTLTALNELNEVKQILKGGNLKQQVKSIDIFGIFSNSNMANNKMIVKKSNNYKTDREQICFKLIDNIDSIINLISPVVQESLVSDELFINFLKQSEHLENSLTWEQIYEDSKEFSGKFDIIKAYLCYHVLDDKQELHENVLKAFEKLQYNFQYN